MTIYDNQFGRIERLLHQFAFRSGFSQEMLADLESVIFAETLAAGSLDRPIFLSGLPRSGTTILLKLLVDSGHFASHTYQDMPFVLCPVLWNRFSRHFTTEREPRERAHGDGIAIGSESPEAFEEIIWKRFWREHYKPEQILPWKPDESNSEFEEFFESHMLKVVSLRQTKDARTLRYLSKNNVNIARLNCPPSSLRRGTIVVPFREPFQHAASMFLQHQRLSNLQAEDRFALQYMEGIGHHDFGLGLRPINFDGWLDGAGSAGTYEFWLRYWIASYGHVLDSLHAPDRLLPYDQLASDPEPVLRYLAACVHIPEEDLASKASSLHSPRTHEVDIGGIDPRLRRQARAIFEQLDKAWSRS